jgi:hypothetical protein
MSTEIEKAFNVIKKEMVDDDPGAPGSYAHAWHCIIAMMCYDAISDAGIVDAVFNDDIHSVGLAKIRNCSKICIQACGNVFRNV